VDAVSIGNVVNNRTPIFSKTTVHSTVKMESAGTATMCVPTHDPVLYRNVTDHNLNPPTPPVLSFSLFRDRV
jgi:hypothetical protein